MADLINDGSLVLFAPLNEPSGVPYFRNLSPAYKDRTESFNLHGEITNPNGGTDLDRQPGGLWPGTDTYFDTNSGVRYNGYRCQGAADYDIQGALGFGSGSKCLIFGVGTDLSRALMAPPDVAQSGWTVGCWILPNSDGAWGKSGFATSNELNAERHTILGRGNGTAGFCLGVSGLLAQGAQAGRNADDLKAFLHIKQNSLHLTTPVESGRYTHLTATYRFINGTINQYVLYKDGRLAASGTSNVELGANNAGYIDRPLSVGGGSTTNTTAALYGNQVATGWGNFVSGVYGFDRVLHEGEILELHQRGGLQGFSPPSAITSRPTLDDPNLILYLPFISPGLIDASKFHHNCYANTDEGHDVELVICPGPFGHGMAFHNDVNTTDIGIATPSGVIQQILNGNGSFSIGGHFFIRGLETNAAFDVNSLISIGSIGTAELTPARQTAGLHISTSGATNAHRLIARVYDKGTQVPIPLHTSDTNMWSSMLRHIGFVYDGQTNAAAFYVDGNQVGSGTLPNNFANQILKLAGSGYPFVFLNGVVSETVDSFDTNAGDQCGVSDAFIFSRPLLPTEIRGIAQSGIDLSKTYYTIHDPRLRGYWKGTEQVTNDLIFPDYAACFAGDAIPGHMVKALPASTWSLLYGNINNSQQARLDLLERSHGTQGAGDVWGAPLGFTSGAWAVMSGSDGSFLINSSNDNKRTSSNSYPLRWRPSAEDRDVFSQHITQEYLVHFDVTPSGTIPATFDAVNQNANCCLFSFGEQTSGDRFLSYLTSVNAAAGSGVTVCFDARDASIGQKTLASGAIPFGFPSKVLLRVTPIAPYDFSDNQHNRARVCIYVNGQKVNQTQFLSDTMQLWSDQAIGIGSSVDWLLSIGGRPLSDLFNTQTTGLEVGLGQIHLKNFGIWVGAFSEDDVNYIATSGLRASSLNGFSDTISTTQVTTADPSLKGFWRFTGVSPASGITDLSINNNKLVNLAQQLQERPGGPPWNNINNAADRLRFIPGPFSASAHPLKGSGISYLGVGPTTAQNIIAPFAVSGAAFNTPNNGFTIGFWLAPRAATAISDNNITISYGPVPTGNASTTFVDASWAVMQDANSNIVMFLSQDGRMPTDGTRTDLVVRCPIVRQSAYRPGDTFANHRLGAFEPGHLDALQHYIFSFDKNNKLIKGYLNGERVTQASTPASGFHIPLSLDARFISFLYPQETNPWTFGSSKGDLDSVLFEPFYMSRSISDSEARYIAMNGFADAATTIVSGCIGGYLQGKDNVSGIIGGYTRGLNYASGIIGSYINAISGAQGIIGGYINAQNQPASGTIGGYLRGMGNTSGIIGGYLAGINAASGTIGGYVTAGFSGAIQFGGEFRLEAFSESDFDAQIVVRNHSSCDFDSQLLVFQSEKPPTVSIIVPGLTVSGERVPHYQYFVGQAVPQQGKVITKAIFNFSDFTGAQAVSISGTNLYAIPANHVFNQSGIFQVRFTAIDSNGQHNSATRTIHLASGITPVNITLSGVPNSGNSPLYVQFAQKIESVPNGISTVANLLDFDDGQTTITLNPLHSYTEPGFYRPLWITRCSRGFIWVDSLNVGINN